MLSLARNAKRARHTLSTVSGGRIEFPFIRNGNCIEHEPRLIHNNDWWTHESEFLLSCDIIGGAVGVIVVCIMENKTQSPHSSDNSMILLTEEIGWQTYHSHTITISITPSTTEKTNYANANYCYIFASALYDRVNVSHFSSQKIAIFYINFPISWDQAHSNSQLFWFLFERCIVHIG